MAKNIFRGHFYPFIARSQRLTCCSRRVRSLGTDASDSDQFKSLQGQLEHLVDKQSLMYTKPARKKGRRSTVSEKKLLQQLSDSQNDEQSTSRTLLNAAEGNSPSTSLDDIDKMFPSDVEEERKKERSEMLKTQAYRRYKPSIDPEKTSVLIFPGQGAQYVGMGKTLLQYPHVRRLYERSHEILGYNLLKLCLEGPDDELTRTVHCQPAVFVHSLACVQKLKAENPLAIENCIGTAGFSVGEFAALVFTGAINFDEALEVVKARAEAMQKATEEAPGAMLVVKLKANSKLGVAMETAKKYCQQKLAMPDVVCQIANYLYPECKVIGGHEEAMRFIETNAADFMLETKRLRVSGAFHTTLMMPACEEVKTLLQAMQLQRPAVPAHSNVSGRMYGSVRSVERNLSRQVYRPVRWEQIMHILYERPQGHGFPNTYEVGPSRTLGALLRKVNMKAYKQYQSIDG